MRPPVRPARSDSRRTRVAPARPLGVHRQPCRYGATRGHTSSRLPDWHPAMPPVRPRRCHSGSLLRSHRPRRREMPMPPACSDRWAAAPGRSARAGAVRFDRSRGSAPQWPDGRVRDESRPVPLRRSTLRRRGIRAAPSGPRDTSSPARRHRLAGRTRQPHAPFRAPWPTAGQAGHAPPRRCCAAGLSGSARPARWPAPR